MDRIWIDADLQDNSNLFCAAAIIDTVSCLQVEPSWDLDYLGVVDVQPPGISKKMAYLKPSPILQLGMKHVNSAIAAVKHIIDRQTSLWRDATWMTCTLTGPQKQTPASV